MIGFFLIGVERLVRYSLSLVLFPSPIFDGLTISFSRMYVCVCVCVCVCVLVWVALLG